MPILVIAPGDRVDIVARLDTSDPDENGEGEPLVIKSSGGFSATIAEYAQARSFSFTANSSGEVLSGFIRGFDGEESGVVTVTVNSKQKKRFTEEQKAALAKASAELNTNAGNFTVVALLCAAIPDPTITKVCVIGFLALSGTAWVLSGRLNELALDPSDPNFTTIAQPDPPALPELTVGGGVTQEEADAYNSLLVNLEKSIGFAGATITAINRAQGAADAGAVAFETAQVQAANGFAAQLSQLLAQQGSLRATLRTALISAGFPTLTVTPSQVLNFEIQVAFGSGLPSLLTTDLSLAGADALTIADIRKLAIVQDANRVAGSFPDKLVDPSLLNALQALASILTPDIVPPVIAVHTDTSTLWPPNGNTVPVNFSGSVTDDGSGVDRATVTFSVTDEYGVVQPHGNIALNTDGTYSFSVPLEARRNGADLDGRLYTIEVRASDVVGNAARSSVAVVVLHDQR